MQKILVFGRSGSGKSTLATKLGRIYSLPVFHMDKYYFLPGWVERSVAEMAADIENILSSNNSWVIDGNYKKTLFEQRVQKSDLIIILNFSFITCLYRALKRQIIHRGKTRPDMQIDCKEKLNWAFVKHILNYRSRALAPIEKILSKYPEKKILRFRNQLQVDEWLRYGKV